MFCSILAISQHSLSRDILDKYLSNSAGAEGTLLILTDINCLMEDWGRYFNTTDRCKVPAKSTLLIPPDIKYLLKEKAYIV